MAEGEFGNQMQASEELLSVREQARLAYLTGLALNGAPELRPAFVPNGTPEELVDEVLLQNLSRGVRLVEISATGLHDAIRIGRDDQPGPVEEAAVLQVGWMEREDLVRGAGGFTMYVLRPTVPGKLVINAVRAASGETGVETQRESNRAAQATALSERRKHLQEA